MALPRKTVALLASWHRGSAVCKPEFSLSDVLGVVSAFPNVYAEQLTAIRLFRLTHRYVRFLSSWRRANASVINPLKEPRLVMLWSTAPRPATKPPWLSRNEAYNFLSVRETVASRQRHKSCFVDNSHVSERTDGIA